MLLFCINWILDIGFLKLEASSQQLQQNSDLKIIPAYNLVRKEILVNNMPPHIISHCENQQAEQNDHTYYLGPLHHLIAEFYSEDAFD
jgi:hypothetical protein